MTNKFTREEFTAAMERAVAERGEEFVYPRGEDDWSFEGYHHDAICVYAHRDGTPACLIGQALYYIDPKLVPQGEIADGESAGNAYAIVGQFTDDYDLMNAAHSAQAVQDTGGDWGEALADYKACLEQGVGGGE